MHMYEKQNVIVIALYCKYIQPLLYSNMVSTILKKTHV